MPLRVLHFVFAGLAFLAACSTQPDRSLQDARETHGRILELKSAYIELKSGGESRQARDTIRTMLAVDPEHPLPYVLTVEQHREKETYDDAEQELRGLGSKGPGLNYGLGRIQFNLGEEEEAKTVLKRALAGYREIGHLPGEGSAHYMLGVVLRMQKSYDEASSELTQAVDCYKSLDDPDALLIISGALLDLATSRSGSEEAERILNEGAALVAKSSDPDAEADWWRRAGRAYANAGKLNDARAAYFRSAALRRASGNQVELITTLRDLARVGFSVQPEEEAEQAWAEAVATAEAIGNSDLAVIVRVDRGIEYRNAGQPYEALPMLEDAVARARKLDSSEPLPYALSELGLTQLKTGNYLQAEESLLEAIDLLKPDRLRTIRCHIDLSKAMSKTGNLTGALQQAQIAREAAAERHNLDLEGRAVNNLGYFYHETGLHDLALQHFREYIEITRETKNVREEAFARVNLGVVLMNQKQFEEAQAEFENAHALATRASYRKIAATASLWLAQMKAEQGDLDEGYHLVEQALLELREVGEPSDVTAALIVLGTQSRKLGRLDPAMKAYVEAVEIATEFGLSERFWAASAGLAAVQAELGHPKEALKQYNLALEAIESRRMRLETDEFKMRFLARRDHVYEDAIFTQLALDPAAASETFAFAERARARSLGDLLAEARTVMRAELSEGTARRERELIDAVSTAAQRWSDAESPDARNEARRALEAAEQRLQFFKLEIRREAPRGFDVAYPEPARADGIRADVLYDNEWMLRYFIGAERALVWVIDRETIRLHELPAPKEIAALIAEYLGCCARAGVSRPGIEEAEALARALLPPGLPRKERLIVVPDGPLYHLPFDVLRHDDKFLVEDYEIQVVPSATMLRMMREHESTVAPERFLGVGNPIVADDDRRFPPLPDAAKGLTEIADRFPETDRVLLVGKEATKQNLRAQPLDQFRFVHFATHGLLDRENPRYYGLRLSPSDEGAGSGYLYFNDVFGLRLRSELVVLSACRSGDGELLRGEGLVGLTGAFLYAGSRSVLATLWNVNDRSTAEFMTQFYAEIARGRTVPEALRRTKLDFLGSDRPARRQPYRWAPFVLVGDSQTK